MGIGQIAGPLAGSYLTLSYGFRYTEDIVALINFCYFVLYISVGNGWEAFASLKKSHREGWNKSNKSFIDDGTYHDLGEEEDEEDYMSGDFGGNPDGNIQMNLS